VWTWVNARVVPKGETQEFVVDHEHPREQCTRTERRNVHADLKRIARTKNVM
jgi:hypothetical protein